MNRYLCNGTLSDSFVNFTTYVINTKLALGSIYILPIISLIGNSLTIIVLHSNHQLNRSSFAIYVKTLAVSDTLVLFYKLFSYENKQRQNPIHFLCTAFQFLTDSTVIVSVWTIVLITIERTLIILFPLHIKKIISGYRARVLVILTIIVVLISSSRLLFIKMDKNINTRCQPRQDWSQYAQLNSTITEFLYMYIPLLVIIIGNCLSFWTLRRALNDRHMMLTSHTYKHKRMDTNEKQLIIMLFVVTLMFIFYFIPFTLMRIIPRTGFAGKCFTSNTFSVYLLMRTEFCSAAHIDSNLTVPAHESVSLKNEENAQKSTETKFRLRLLIYLHFLLGFIIISQLILYHTQLLSTSTSSHSIPKPHLWEYIWLISLLASLCGLLSLHRNNLFLLKLFFRGTVIFGLGTIMSTIIINLSDLFSYRTVGATSEIKKTFYGVPLLILWYIFLIITVQIHAFTLYMANILLNTWQSNKRQN
ncbi:unnamed protein product [Didymodactylos carnosus]|uniref:G-protein coupled receptors family 1 profile domain-containing protein n=1 Tax=Didymodactylos carnosus TaxID=1234261 RepID=A0A813W884_9BILA|nr:unnamed protein product [Didymodactylos carnosus]CAF0894968.1 unnamed protein product [Didymodactylos carnosus]CAF3641867.1 unnamed protein product [Didymodactylos carnosus]CAF3676621.1 unnamed protein product [Didymodactylos carnosus]